MAISEERSGERNWSELPEDILHLFSKKLHDISDFIHFRAVCKSWQLSALVTDPPAQLPWLMEHNQGPEKSDIIRFYCLLSGKVHTFTSPGSRDAFLMGPACHHILTSHRKSSEMYLLNPLTNDRIHVPFLSVVYDGRWLPDYIGPDPIEGGNIVVIFGRADWSTQSNMMAFWRPMADNWVYVEGVGGCFNANAFYMGQYFSSNGKTGITSVIDITTQKLAYQVAPPEDTNPLLKGRTIMVESGGKILRLFQHYEAKRCHFDIHCLYFGDGEGKPCWVKITDIGEQMLFLQYYCGFSFCASNFAGFKGNCIYFLKKWKYLCRYDIGDGTTEVLPCPFDSVDTWFVPGLI